MDKQNELACGSCGYTADPACEICSPEVSKQDATWVGAPGYEERYQVSDQGEVRSNGRILKPAKTWDGYLQVGFYKGDTQRKQKIHRLVCIAFHGPQPAPEYHAGHRNGNSLDNRAVNLRWVTPSENERDKRVHGTASIGERNPFAKLTDNDIVEIRKYAEAGEHQRAIASRFGITQSLVSGIVRRKKWAHIP